MGQRVGFGEFSGLFRIIPESKIFFVRNSSPHPKPLSHKGRGASSTAAEFGRGRGIRRFMRILLRILLIGGIFFCVIKFVQPLTPNPSPTRGEGLFSTAAEFGRGRGIRRFMRILLRILLIGGIFFCLIYFIQPLTPNPSPTRGEGLFSTAAGSRRGIQLLRRAGVQGSRDWGVGGD